jgi:hypothetical protein
MNGQLVMDKRGRGRPRYSRPGGRRYILMGNGTTSNGQSCRGRGRDSGAA